jgi:hypothetical protein
MTKFEAFMLRVSLLKIWLLKNTTVFLKLGFLILVILTLTGQFDANTPVLSWTGIGDLSEAIKVTFANILDSNGSQLGVDFWSALLGSTLSVFVAVGTLSSNVKHIALRDIKSVQLKRALIKAGLFFNRDGKLVKKIEETIRIDIDGDNKIGNVDTHLDEIHNEGFFSGVKRTVNELGSIVSVKIDTVEDANRIKEKANLNKTSESLDQVNNITTNTAVNIVEEKVLKVTKSENNVNKTNVIKKLFNDIRMTIKKSKEKSDLKRKAKLEASRNKKLEKLNKINATKTTTKVVEEKVLVKPEPKPIVVDTHAERVNRSLEELKKRLR